jgi:hypothetical protein
LQNQTAIVISTAMARTPVRYPLPRGEELNIIGAGMCARPSWPGKRETKIFLGLYLIGGSRTKRVKSRNIIALDLVLASSNRRLAVRGSVELRRRRCKDKIRAAGEYQRITRRTRLITQTLDGISIAMAGTPIRYAPRAAKEKDTDGAIHKERPAIVAGR